VVALGYSASKTELVTADRRFYRVVQDPSVTPAVLFIRHAPAGGVEIDWAPAGFTLESATSVIGPYAVISPPVTSGPCLIPIPTGQAFYRLFNGVIYSVNRVGRVTLNLLPGMNLIANPFNYGDNNLNTILPLPPSAVGTTVNRFDVGTQSWGPQAVFNGTIWTSTSPNPNWLVLSPGESFFIGVGAPLSVTLMGEVLQGTVTVPIVGGGRQSCLASAVPQEDSLGTGPGVGLEFPARDGDVVWLWDAATQTYVGAWQYEFGFGGWLDENGNVGNGPVIRVGSGFVLRADVPRLWTRNF
jgi:hypothetical protein